MAGSTILRDMLEQVARALGSELREQMTFVGGCTTGLLLTDEFAKEQVRHTDDVDLIVHVLGYVGFSKLQEQLKERGFRVTIPEPGETLPICAMKLRDLRVDFMPDDEKVLKFSNRWYKAAMETATTYQLTPELTIRIVTPVYFLATKLEAYKGRGQGDALSSRDIEDILNLVDGRKELVDEMRSASREVRSYVADELAKLLEDTNFEYAVASQARGNPEREALVFERLGKIIAASPEKQE